MQSSSLSISDALSAEEVCPLCLDHYTAADECVCVVCRAPSCPTCAEVIDVDGAMRCFACRPAAVAARTAAAARDAAPLPLPLPLPIAAYAPLASGRGVGEPPPLPFPLTTSPLGVRQLKPRPVGSVFVGLPPVAPELASVPSAPSARRAPLLPSPSVPPPLPRSPRTRVRTRLALARVQGERALRICVERGQQQWRALEARWPGYQLLLLSWVRAGLAQAQRLSRSAWRAPLAPRLRTLGGERLRASLASARASLLAIPQSPLAQRGVARLLRWRDGGVARLRRVRRAGAALDAAACLRWSQAQLERVASWSAARLARPIAALATRALPRAKPITRSSDHSRPISL